VKIFQKVLAGGLIFLTHNVYSYSSSTGKQVIFQKISGQFKNQIHFTRFRSKSRNQLSY